MTSPLNPSEPSQYLGDSERWPLAACYICKTKDTRTNYWSTNDLNRKYLMQYYPVIHVSYYQLITSNVHNWCLFIWSNCAKTNTSESALNGQVCIHTEGIWLGFVVLNVQQQSRVTCIIIIIIILWRPTMWFVMFSYNTGLYYLMTSWMSTVFMDSS